jgi:phage-related protein
MLTRYKTSFTLSSPQGTSPRGLDIETVWGVLERWVQDNDGVVIGSNNQDRVLPNGTGVIVENWRAPTGLLRALRYDRRTKTQEAWTADVGLQSHGEDVEVFVALGNAALSRHRISRTPAYAPRFVRQLLSIFAASAGLSIEAQHRVVTDASDVDWLVDTLLSPDRQRPVIVVSVNPFSEKPVLLTPSQIDERMAGLAHVVLLQKRAGLDFRRRLERSITDRERANKWTVYEGAIRVYWPGIDLKSAVADPFRHRLWLPDDLDERTLDAIFRQAADYAIVRHDPTWVSCDSVRAAALEASRTDRSAHEELLDEEATKVARLVKENEDLQYQLEEAHDRATDAERSADNFRYRVNELTKTLEAYKSRLPQDSESIDGDRLTLVRYRRGNKAERDCVEEMLREFPDEAETVLLELDWLTNPANWDVSNKNRRLSQIGDDLWEFRVDVANHWFRFFLRRIHRLALVTILHCYPKQQNRLDATEVGSARERANELFA